MMFNLQAEVAISGAANEKKHNEYEIEWNIQI